MSSGPWKVRSINRPLVKLLKNLNIPYPVNGTPVEKGQWYLAQVGSEREAVKNGKLDPELAKVSLMQLRAMLKVESDLIIPTGQKLPPNPPGQSLRDILPPPEPIKQTPESIRALERSRGMGRHDHEGDDSEE